MLRRLPIAPLLVWLVGLAPATAHDIPNARVDRSIQATIRPGRLTIAYEVSLSELTLAQDLRSLTGSLPQGDPAALYDLYGRETAPLNARGLLVSVDGEPVDLVSSGFQVAVEEHPRYSFQFEAPLPSQGRLTIQDTNYAASEGTSRLALRSLAGVEVRGNDGPEEVDQVPIRPVWQLSNDEERRTREITVSYTVDTGSPNISTQTPAPPPVDRARTVASGPMARGRLSDLLRRASGVSLVGLWVIAFGLGMAHAIQPGHGKTLVAAAVVGERGGWSRGLLLALVTTAAHFGGVLAIAAVLWVTRSTRYEEMNRGLTQGAGFVIAAVGLWRLGRHLAGYGEHDPDRAPPTIGTRGIIGLGLAGGIVPCWDAVLLVVVAELLGRLALGLFLLSGFSLGMAVVLVVVGLAAARIRRAVDDPSETWERRLGLLSGLALTAIGLSFLMV